jgi:hypothetical protein
MLHPRIENRRQIASRLSRAFLEGTENACPPGWCNEKNFGAEAFKVNDFTWRPGAGK